MKNILLVLSILILAHFSADAQTRQLYSFEELMQAVKSGTPVRMVFQYARCELISDNEKQDKIPDAIGGMPLDVFEYFAPNAVRNKEAFIVASENRLIENPKGDGYVYNYVKVKIMADNSVKISARYLNPVTLAEQMDENFFGRINDGKNEGGILLYANE